MFITSHLFILRNRLFLLIPLMFLIYYGCLLFLFSLNLFYEIDHFHKYFRFKKKKNVYICRLLFIYFAKQTISINIPDFLLFTTVVFSLMYLFCKSDMWYILITLSFLANYDTYRLRLSFLNMYIGYEYVN